MPKNRKRKRGPSSYGSAINTAVRALKVANTVKSLLNVEFKNIDTVVANNKVDWGGSSWHLTPIVQGDEGDDRDGESCKVKRVCVRGYISSDTSLQLGAVVRITLWRSVKGFENPITNALDQAYAATTNFVNAPKEYTVRKFWKILAEKYLPVSDNFDNKMFKFNVAQDAQCTFSGTSTQPTENAYYISAISNIDSAVASTGKPGVSFVARTWYLDN